jgi:hypothetical protein
MADFFIKSILSLGVLYVFYLLVLSRIKTFHFNRFFLLGSLAFSLAIPFISIPVNDTALPIIQSAGKVSLSSTIEYSGEFIASKEVEQNAMISYLPYFYAAISLILLLRFSVNLFSIAKTIIKNQKIKKAGFSMVLLSNQIIPYSFFSYVLVNEHQYQSGTIEEALIQHEITHCRQWHSLDILWVELIKVLFWINPFIWLMKKSVQLNHEFLADDSVLSNHSITNYKNLLINLVLKHNSGILISNFNYSLTKQRLKMMTKQVTPLRAAFGRTASLFLFLLIAMTISCHREIIEPVILSDKQVEWWEPILKVHNIEPAAYNNFPHVFEMGTTNSINDGVVSLENAFFLFRPVDFHSKEVDENSYIMLEAPFATHDLNTDSIKTDHGKIRMFALKEGKITSVNQYTFSKMKMFVNENKFFFSVYEVTSQQTKIDANEVTPEKYHYNISVRW